MSRNMKIILGVGGVLMLLCFCGIAASVLVVNTAGEALGQAIATEPGDVDAIADEIADYRLPPGYTEAFGMRLMGVAMVAYQRASSGSMIMLMQYPQAAGLDEEEMQEQMREALRNQGGTWYEDFQMIAQRDVNIRGQRVTLTISEGSSPNTGSLRQAMALFEGRGGPVLLMIMEPTNSWNDRGIRDFLASIR
jgi:hypothetical protein